MSGQLQRDLFNCHIVYSEVFLCPEPGPPATGLKNSHFIMRKQSENCLYPFLKHQHSKTENRMGLKNIFVSKRTAKNNIFHLNLALSSTFLHIAFTKEY